MGYSVYKWKQTVYIVRPTSLDVSLPWALFTIKASACGASGRNEISSPPALRSEELNSRFFLPTYFFFSFSALFLFLPTVSLPLWSILHKFSATLFNMNRLLKSEYDYLYGG